ncbi:large-conductance mechanosensitive channel protein MscL [Lentzea sp. NBC_00516]|uniref:large-conductance mechanosensitive channel protein MscL n=1 Tax=Lentzea sp. NBC_00516 TaxID=2903582 RepID=UPI002E7FFDBB|nr:large-conductance mechanosensitive channel protein MscL [Lentzea sp. NBC_00516]WUD22109.1 large-conductance mechanosensitive channel protein MscL [Lentzea sp. NBC_00516]
MLKGFKDFLMRGNVVDLAVAVVIGTAFTAIVTAFTTSLIKPLISSLGSTETAGLGIQLREGKADTYLDFSNIINAAINFVIVAAVVYFVLVLPIQKIQERRKRGEEAGPSEPTNVELLIEIRDLLAAQQNTQPQTPAQAPDRRGPAI